MSVSSTGTGFVRNSVLTNVRCRHIEAEGCVLINVTADSIIARPGSIIYNYVHTKLGDAVPVLAAGAALATTATSVSVSPSPSASASTAEVPATKRAKLLDGCPSSFSTSSSSSAVSTAAGDVVVGVFSEDGSQVVIKSHLEKDGGKTRRNQFLDVLWYYLDAALCLIFMPFRYIKMHFLRVGKEWEKRAHVENAYTFEQIYDLNASVCPSKLQKLIAELHDDAWQNL